MERTRSENYTVLLEELEPHRLDNSAGTEEHRYASVSEEFWDEQRVGALTELCDTVEEAFEILSDSVLDGYARDGVYDLEMARGSRGGRTLGH